MRLRFDPHLLIMNMRLNMRIEVLNLHPIEDSPSLIDRGRHNSVSQINAGSPLRRSERAKIP